MKHFNCIFTVLALALTPTSAWADAPDGEAVDAHIKENRRSVALLPAKSFTLAVTAATAMDGVDFGLGSVDVRQVSAAVTLRYGLAPGTEIFGQAPIGRTRIETSLLGVSERNTYTTGVVEAGIRQLISHHTDISPEIVVSASFAAPVGNLPGAEPHARVAVAAYQVVDPVVLSGEVGVGVGTRTGEYHIDIEGKFDFAINDRVAIGFGANWSSAGTDFGDPLDTGVSVTGSVTLTSPSGANSLTPYVSIGASRAAPDVVLGFSWSRRW